MGQYLGRSLLTCFLGQDFYTVVMLIRKPTSHLSTLWKTKF